MRACVAALGIFGVIVLMGCSTQKVIVTDSYSGGFKSFPYPDGQYANQIPERLRAGTADVVEVVEWSKGLIDENTGSGGRYPWPLIPAYSFSDLNMDGKSEILVDIPWASGATGNRGAAFFLASNKGYRYVGTISRIASRACYPQEQRCYLMTFGNSGQELTIRLIEIRSDSLSIIAECRTNKFDSEGNNTILTFPERHEALLANFGLSSTSEGTALAGCSAVT